MISLLFINRVLKATNNKFGEIKFASCAKKNHVLLPLIRVTWLLKLSLQSTELWLAKKRHENVCIQRFLYCNLVANFKKAEKKQVKFVIHRIHKWRIRRKKLVPSNESEALEDKQILQMKTAQV